MNDICVPTEIKQRATKLHKLTKRTNSFAGYELRTSSSPSKGTQDAETSQLSLTGSYLVSRGEARQEERDKVAPVITHKPLLIERQIKSLNCDKAIPSVLSSPDSGMTLSHYQSLNIPTQPTGYLSLAGIPALVDDEEQMQFDDP